MKETNAATAMNTPKPGSTAVTYATTSTTVVPATASSMPSPFPLDQRDPVGDLFSRNNSGCRLPCWWGLKVGEVNLEMIGFFLAPLDIQEYSVGDFTPVGINTYGFVNRGSGYGTFGIQYWIMDNVNVATRIGLIPESSLGEGRSFLYNNYSLAAILSEFGAPSEVLIGLVASAPEPTPTWDYSLWVFYHDQGFAINYRGFYQLPRPSETTISVCHSFASTRVIDIYLQPAGFREDLRAWEDGKGWAIAKAEDELRTWEESTNLSIDDFLATFATESEDDCFVSPVELW